MAGWTRSDLSKPPSCIGGKPRLGTEWRILRKGNWLHIECRTKPGAWEGGLAGTAEWLGLSEQEIAEAF